MNKSLIIYLLKLKWTTTGIKKIQILIKDKMNYVWLKMN